MMMGGRNRRSATRHDDGRAKPEVSHGHDDGQAQPEVQPNIMGGQNRQPKMMGRPKRRSARI